MALSAMLVGIVLATVISSLAGALALRLLGIGVPRVDLGVWSPKIRFSIGTSAVSLSPWLISGSSTAKNLDNADVYADVPGKLLDSLNRIVRALLHLIGPLSVLAASMLFVGIDALPAFVTGFRQAIVGALYPFSYAQIYLSDFSSLATNSPVFSIGIALAKLAAFSLLPAPPLNGGQGLLELIRPRSGKLGTIAGLAQQISNFAVFLIFAMWLIALGWWLFHKGAI
ncbi:hypothetical protein [Pseudoxanthomonas sp.]|uniref:hypothetical protein n=1 Tax=Pseudoxanthomonas sp. TaxID=1871049 RepID=UPI002FE00F74